MERTTTARALSSWTLAACLGLSGTAVAQKAEVSLTFGVYTSDKPTTMYRQFAPIIEELEKGVSKALGKSTEIQLRVLMTYDEGLEALVKGQIDFARFGAASYVLAHEQDDKVQLLAMESEKGQKSFQGMIVVRTDSDIQKMSDLRGRTFAFGDENSTIGRFLAQLQLIDANITAKDLRKFEYLERHDRVFRAVQIKDFEAGSVKSSTFHKMNKKKQLRILVDFDVPTKPWVARSGLPAPTAEAIRTALLALKDKKALANLKVDGFLPTSDAEYVGIRKSMRAALLFQPPAAKPAPKPAR